MESISKNLVGISYVGKHFGTEYTKEYAEEINLAKKDIEDTFGQPVSGSYRLALISECYWYYKKQIYYHSLSVLFHSSVIGIRQVTDYLQKMSVDDRHKILINMLESSKRKSALKAIGYFCKTFPTRRISFREHLTKYEYGCIY